MIGKKVKITIKVNGVIDEISSNRRGVNQFHCMMRSTNVYCTVRYPAFVISRRFPARVSVIACHRVALRHCRRDTADNIHQRHKSPPFFISFSASRSTQFIKFEDITLILGVEFHRYPQDIWSRFNSIRETT